MRSRARLGAVAAMVAAGLLVPVGAPAGPQAAHGPFTGRAAGEVTSEAPGTAGSAATMPVAETAIAGTDGPDVLVGTARADTIHGRRGADRITGKGGADRLFGNAGADIITGSKDRSRDRLYGGPGHDRIDVYTADRVFAGSGNDVIRFKGVTTWQYVAEIHCGSGRDHVYGVPGDRGERRTWLYRIAKDCELVHWT